MLMSKALRQMPAESAGRVAVARGEAARGAISDEAAGPRQDTKSTGLNFSNRPVRTRMPGGVAGAQSMMTAPYADLKQSRFNRRPGIRPVQ